MFKNILIVDDDKLLLDYFSLLLRQHGLKVICAENVKKAEKEYTQKSVDLMLLDINMPGEDGLSFCQRIAEEVTFPIVMLTAVDDDNDCITCLEAGAVDYITKPFNANILVPKLKNILSVYDYAKASDKNSQKKVRKFVFDQWELDTHQHILVDQNGGETPLNKVEYLLLTYFLAHKNRLLCRESLLEAVYAGNYEINERAVDLNISRLRRKLAGSADRIKTIYGQGYIFKLN
ncbi:response regulator transcription factor [Facilibium subflavum]|uniref:response regulator transcription factor n=1 Tax=Facilibium subflavum TaxID=2219058 RepID=UPI000E64D95D|nr:response regulator transcription factor [Facilibium subflavum]